MLVICIACAFSSVLKSYPTMSEKMSTLVLEVDLGCSKCYNKLQRILCQFKYEIRSQSIDPQQNTVTISGPFDPEEFAKKLKNMAGKTIKSIEMKKVKKVTFAPQLEAAPAPAPAPEPAPPKAMVQGPEMIYVDPGPVRVYPMVQPYGGYAVDYVSGGPVYDECGRPMLGYDWGYGGNSGYTNYVHGSDHFSERDPTCSLM